MSTDIDPSTNTGLSSGHIALVIALLALLLLAVALVGVLIYLRSVRRARNQSLDNARLPLHEKRQPSHTALTITAVPYKHRESLAYSEKQELMHREPDSPASPVPEIRITFPDEVDESGHRQSGRVVVVRVGDHSVGLEPVQEHLPPYQRSASDRFDSLDLDRLGGLKEKDAKDYA